MKRISIVLAFILIFSINSYSQGKTDITKKPDALPEKTFKFPEFNSTTLKNGLKVFIVENHEQPIVSLNFLIAGGNSQDGDKPGLAEMLSLLLTKGADKMTALDIAQQLDGVGAAIRSSSNDDATNVSASCLKKHLPLLLDILSKVMTKPTFPNEELEKQVPQMIAGIQQQKSSPSTLASMLTAKVLYGDEHPYSLAPTEASVKKITTEDVKDFYKKYFVPNNITLAIVGDVDKKEIIKELEKVFKDWKKGKAPVISIPPAKPLPIGVYFIKRPSSVQSSITVSTMAIPYNNKDFETLDIASNIIGAGFAGRLFRTLREKYSYTYTPFGHVTTNKYANIFECGADVRNSVTDSAITVIKEQLTNLAKRSPSEEELNRVVSFEVGRYYMAFEGSDFIASLIQSSDFHNIPMERVKAYPETIKALTPPQIRDMANRYMNPDAAYIVVVGSPEVREKLEQFGKIFDYDLDLNPLTGAKAKMEKVSLTAKDLIDKYTDAIGGKDAIGKIQSLTDSGKVSLEIQGRPIPGKIIQIRKAPNKKYQLFDITFQKQEEWFDGTNAWTCIMNKVDKKEGDELEDISLDAAMFSYTKLLDLNYKCEVLGKQDGMILMKAVSPKGGEKTFYFDANTFLLYKIEETAVTPQGPIPVTIELTDYTSYEGVKLPKFTISDNPMFKMKLESRYFINTPVDDAMFAPQTKVPPNK